MTYYPQDGEAVQALNDAQSYWNDLGYGVLNVSGGSCNVTINSGTLDATDTLSVASGRVYAGDSSASVSSTTVGINSVSDNASRTEVRYDTIWVDSTGTVNKTEGTAVEITQEEADAGVSQFGYFSPSVPFPSTEPAVVLAVVVVTDADSSLTSSDIQDRRVPGIGDTNLPGLLQQGHCVSIHSSGNVDVHTGPSAPVDAVNAIISASGNNVGKVWLGNSYALSNTTYYDPFVLSHTDILPVDVVGLGYATRFDGGTSNHAVHLNGGTNNLSFAGFDFRDFYAETTDGGGSTYDAVRLTGTTETRVSNFRIQGSDHDAIGLYGAETAWISDFFAEGVDRYGVYMTDTSQASYGSRVTNAGWGSINGANLVRAEQTGTGNRGASVCTLSDWTAPGITWTGSWLYDDGNSIDCLADSINKVAESGTTLNTADWVIGTTN